MKFISDDGDTITVSNTPYKNTCRHCRLVKEEHTKDLRCLFDSQTTFEPLNNAVIGWSSGDKKWP